MSLNFGVYLVDQNAITSEQFFEALRERLKDTIPLGQLALRRRKLSLKQAFEILRIQTERPGPFGQVAMECGYLTEAQLAELLYFQSEQQTSLVSILIGLGALTQADADHHFAAYRTGLAKESSRPVIDTALVGRSITGNDDLSVM